MNNTEHGRRRAVVLFISALVLLGIIATALDWRAVRDVLGQADWRPIITALAFTAVSYGCLSYGFVISCKLFAIRVHWRDLFAIGFVSNVLSNVVAVGGVAGYSVRFLLMRRHGLAVEDIVAASLFHSYINNLAMFALLPIGLTHLFLNHPLQPLQTQALAAAALVLAGLVVIASLVLFSRALRLSTLDLLGGALERLLRRNVRSTLASFDATMVRGTTAISARPLLVAALILLIVVDWTSSVLTLWFCFDALGAHLSPGLLTTGFAVGVMAGLISMVPGGLGVQEGSMAGIYALLGIPFHQAFLAAILFRIVYYSFPFLISLGVYQRLLRR
jgi:uncharacterized protein (TIRG00374 family)